MAEDAFTDRGDNDLCRISGALHECSLTMLVPFSGGHYIDLGWLAIPLMYFAVIGTVNGVNFTDGLDGLASSVTVLVAVFFTVVAVGMNSGIEPVTCAVVGALSGVFVL